jgi:hypothetical protein
VDTVTINRIHTLWDELADFEAASADAARTHLLTSLSDWGGAFPRRRAGCPVHVGQPRFDAAESESNVMNIYRKSGVKNRARFMAFWLGCTVGQVQLPSN